MATSKLNRAEKKRLQQIAENFGYNYTIPVKEHFNAAGRLEAFANAATADDKTEQSVYLKDLLQASAFKADYAGIKIADIFLRAALRVGSDTELASILPAGADLKEQDVTLLEKSDLPSLATVVKAYLAL